MAISNKMRKAAKVYYTLSKTQFGKSVRRRKQGYILNCKLNNAVRSRNVDDTTETQIDHKRSKNEVPKKYR